LEAEDQYHLGLRYRRLVSAHKLQSLQTFADAQHSVCAIAVRRTTLLYPLLASSDYTWDLVEQYHWCYAEVNAAIVCASAPALKPFFARYVPGLLSSRFGSSKRDDYSHQPNSRSALETISQKKSRKLVVKDAYELQSRDDVSEEIKAGNSGTRTPEDEARLWNGTLPEKGYGSARVMAMRNGPGDLEAGRGISPSRRDQTGITVTSETRISYDRK
jgi:hypothetical protein